jgi:phosphoadenosine phosphosulfate reductase
MNMEHLSTLQTYFRELPVAEAISKTAGLFPGSLRFSTSLGQEDQVLTDIIARAQLPVNIFTIDTGRLFNETYELIEKTIARYKINIDIFFPQSQAVQEMVKTHGVNLFYGSVQQRQTCCNTRKVEPLNRALAGASVWITGLRSAQTGLRKSLPAVEWLEDKKIYKINPLINWSFDQVMDYINENNVPFNPLHDQGFVSIGCAPCTRAISKNEDPRAGRWWWETSQKECGLHLVK